jgi:hypothetical protein
MKTEFYQLEATLHTLEAIAKNYPQDSFEYQSIELSAKALLFINSEGDKKKFTEYFRTFNKPLILEQKDFLKKNGIEE